MTASDNTLTRQSATQISALIASRKASPVEVLDAHLARIASLNPKLNAIVTLAEDAARATAKAAEVAVMRGDTIGVLHGLPVVIKDVTETAGIRTTYGCPLYKDFVPDVDAEVVARLRAAGAIILGKTNTPEFATGANTVNDVFGATLNPWNTEMSPAGSSGGSAVAVAVGMVPLAQGTDFGCSVRMPAAFNGIVGVRTTPGLIPNDPMPLIGDAGQVHGPLARTAEDAALMLDAMAGFTDSNPISVTPPWTSVRDAVRGAEDLKGLRIAYVADLAAIGVDGEIARLCRSAALALGEAGATVTEIELDLSEGREAYKTLRGVWMVGQQYERLHMVDRFGPNLAGNLRDGLKVTARDIAEAEAIRQRMWNKTRAALRRYDAITTPMSPVPPYSVTMNFPELVGGRQLTNYIDWIAPAFLVTMLGMPAGSAPAGLTKAGLPVGLQIIASRLAEPRILIVSKFLQALRPTGRPPG
jgi:amidase